MVTARWSRALLRFVAVASLSAGTTLIAWAAVPAMFGWTPTVITSGSMTPALHRGDVVVLSAPAGDWQPAVGQVVVVPHPDRPGATVAHRIAGFDETGRLVTRGDANGSDDAFRTDPQKVVGIARLLVPRLALATQEMREGEPAMFVGQSALMLTALGVARGREPAGSRPGEPSRDTGPHDRATRREKPWARRHRARHAPHTARGPRHRRTAAPRWPVSRSFC